MSLFFESGDSINPGALSLVLYDSYIIEVLVTLISRLDVDNMQVQECHSGCVTGFKTPSLSVNRCRDKCVSGTWQQDLRNLYIPQ